MKVFVTVDERLGVSFNNRRQSRDEVLTDFILKKVNSQPLYMTAYSSKLFADKTNIIETEDFLDNTDNAFCFIECRSLQRYADKITTLFLCRWNRHYPSDTYLDLELQTDFTLSNTVEFEGKSHEKIIVEEWIK